MLLFDNTGQTRRESELQILPGSRAERNLYCIHPLQLLGSGCVCVWGGGVKGV